MATRHSLRISPITARVHVPHEHFLINRYGMLYEEIHASCLIKIDLAGNIIDQRLDRIDPSYRD